MRVPGFVRRATWRVLAAAAACALLTAGAGWIGERTRFGATSAEARARVTAEAQRQVAKLAGQLDAAVQRVQDDSAAVAAAVAEGPEVAGLPELFDRLDAIDAELGVPSHALSVVSLDGRLLAWAGRPGPLPPDRLTGPGALFLSPSSIGLRLTRVAPIVDPQSPDRRLATVVAEAPLIEATDAIPGGELVIQTSIAPVTLRPAFASDTAPPTAVLIRDAQGQPLAWAEVDDRELAAARRRWRDAVLGIELFILAAALLLLSGPLLDWRRLSVTIPGHVVLTLGIVTLLVAARAIAWFAVRFADIAGPTLLTPQLAGRYGLLLASPADFLLTALAAGAIVALAASSFEQWRQSRRMRVRVLPDSGAGEVVAFVACQLLAGVLVGALLTEYEDVLRTRLAVMSVDILHFSLHPFEVGRLAVAMGLVILHAALLALIALVFRLSMTRWVASADHRWIRALAPVLWAAPAIAVLTTAMRDWEQPPLLPAALIAAVGMAVAWRSRRVRMALEHASQATRLTAFFVALAIPSAVFYPSLVEAAGRARRQLIETRYAPEVANQRRNLQLQLNEAIEQIESFRDLPDLVRASDAAAAGGPIPYEAAFRIWERTVLEDHRLTSSVELHDAAGALVSRFALKLPQTGGSQPYQETSCEWQKFEEVSPFFAEERRLLHAGRAICDDTLPGSPVVGSIAVHVMLDYSNLSFITAQSPYVALLRQRERELREPAPREVVDFAVYGWSRQPLYASGRNVWPLSEEVFQRIFASRDPMWARVQHAGAEYDVYFLNDRGGIYALLYERTSPFGHLIRLAELLVLGAATFLVLLLAGLLYGRITARTPVSGRALLREVRASFYRKLFIAFVAAAVLPVLALALVTRAYIATLMQTDLEMEAARTAASASRVVEDVGLLGATDAAGLPVVGDDLVVWLSRVIAQDVNIFDSNGLVASSERSLFAYGLLPRSTQGDVYRAIVLEGRPSFVAREAVGTTEYLVAAAPVRVQNRDAILTVPLTLRQREIEAQIDELDRRVLLAAVLFIVVGAVIGYSLAERIADPVNRLMKATGRLARGELNVRVLATSSDEFRRLLQAFNQMAADLQRQRGELERSHRLAAWAEMARQVAHDIKNPLTPIQLNAEHLRRVHADRGTPLGRVLDDCIDNILAQVRLLRQIAAEFSSFATSPTARPAPTPLHELIDEVLGPYRTGLAGRVTIETDVPSALALVMVDKVVLGRALTNVIENALHAMPSGGTLRVSADAVDSQWIQLRISDTGVGMDRAALERIFEPYFSTRASGTGLGLTIAKRNVELNGGTIDVASERGKGTTVTMTLPTARAAA